MHPTVCILGITSLTGILTIPFKMLTRKINNRQSHSINKEGEKVYTKKI